MDRLLIFNADDFGASTGINRGIVESHLNGVVTSTSLMVTGNAVDDAVARSRECPQLSIGLHWDVWGEDERDFDITDLAAVRDQFEKQLDSFHHKMGTMPTHVDSHRHAHIDASRVVFEYFQELVKPLGIPLRGDGRVHPVLDFYGRAQSSVHGAPEQVSVPFMKRLIAKETRGRWTEIMCHPGYVDKGYRSRYSAQRECEIRTLTDPEIPAWIARNGIHLASYHDFAVHGGMNRRDGDPQGHQESYFEKIWHALDELSSIVPPTEAYVLLDDAQWGPGDFVRNRHRRPYPSRNGLYWGPPPDSKSAIKELRDLREGDVRYLAVAWPAFWWFQYYEEWSEYLRKSGRCVLSNERICIFDLANESTHRS
jgi:predicted glycoside hydrolase/deacetylase ChbG (UPF0249 family)